MPDDPPHPPALDYATPGEKRTRAPLECGTISLLIACFNFIAGMVLGAADTRGLDKPGGGTALECFSVVVFLLATRGMHQDLTQRRLALIGMVIEIVARLLMPSFVRA